MGEIIPNANISTIFCGGTGAEVEFISTLQKISLAVCGFVFLTAIIFFIRKIVTASKSVSISATWGCGYIAPNHKLQYTANSFVRSYRKLVKPFMMMNKNETEMVGVFPNKVHSITHPYDKMESVLIDTPIKFLKKFMGRFLFLQNGNPQIYILYGVIFIIVAISIPLLIDVIIYLVELFKQI
ncbi:MAG: hypothetical protein A3K10_00315 [Bacteroidetes bacterium RIFCSPLOWO2_12_FULL_31_6]|nr:MAG: hypothetical protein A3K10_00315 [Bacteroidetes bacterium RIFCSPLOWO2_12_FULL_31_6]